MKNLLLTVVVALGLTPLAHADMNDDIQSSEMERGWGEGRPNPAPFPGNGGPGRPGNGPGNPGHGGPGYPGGPGHGDPGHGGPGYPGGPGHGDPGHGGPGYPGGPGHGGPGHGGPGYPGPRPEPPRPGPGPGYPYPPPPVYRSEYVRCESYGDNGMQQCWINPYRVQEVRLYQQYSYEPCIIGRTYGWNYDRIWVDRGCRATFEVLRY